MSLTTNTWLKNHHDETTVEIQNQLNFTQYLQHTPKSNYGYADEYIHQNFDYSTNFSTMTGLYLDGNETQFHNATDTTAYCNASEQFHKYFKTFVNCMYIIIFLMAVIGNGIVCFIVQSSPRMRTVTNYFIANLAVGDMLMALFCVPFSFISIFVLSYWPFGEVS